VRFSECEDFPFEALQWRLFHVTFARIEELEFVLDSESFPVGRLIACQVCDAVAHDLKTNQLRVQSEVTVNVARLFVSAVEEETIYVRNENIEGLSDLCQEFQFRSLSQRVGAFKKEM
jgi:hypothetical protein